MKKTKRCLALALCILLLLPMMQGCKQKTPEEIFSDALTNMADLKNMRMKMSMQMNMSVMGQKMSINISTEADVLTNPVKGKMEMKMEAGGMSMEMPMYYEQQGDAFMTYIGMDDGSGVVWYRQQVESAPVSNGMLSASTMAGFEYMEETEQGEDEIWSGSPLLFHDNVKPAELLRYRGMMDAQQLKSLLETSMSGGLDSLTGGDAELLDAVLEKIGKTEMIVTVDKESGYIVRQELDMGPMMSAIMEKALESSGEEALDLDMSSLIEIGEMPVVIEYSRFNEISSIEIPAEALEGELLEEGEEPTAA